LVAAGGLVCVAMLLARAGRGVGVHSRDLLQGPQVQPGSGGSKTLPDWDGILAWATRSRVKQGALQRLELKHSSNTSGAAVPAAPPPALASRSPSGAKGASSYGWLASCSSRGQTGCLRQEGTSLSARSKMWLAPDISTINLTLSRYVVFFCLQSLGLEIVAEASFPADVDAMAPEQCSWRESVGRQQPNSQLFCVSSSKQLRQSAHSAS